MIWTLPYWGVLYLNQNIETRFGSYTFKLRPFLNNGYLCLNVQLFLYADIKYFDVFTLYTSKDYFEFLINEENKHLEFIYDNFLSMLEGKLEKYYKE